MEEKKQKKEHRCEIVAKNKELRWIKKAEKDKKNKREMWGRLKELNNNFAKMKEQKKTWLEEKALFSLGFVYFNMISCKLILIKNILSCK